MKRRRSRAGSGCAGLLLVLVGLTAVRCLAAEPASLLAGFPRAPGLLVTATSCHVLDLYIALSPEQRGQGLMYVRELGEHEGMLFPGEVPYRVSMWMKNTYIPLDMLFIAEDGRITGIAANTVPLSEATISSATPVSAVLELNGGFAERHAVRPGDRFGLFEAARR